MKKSKQKRQITPETLVEKSICYFLNSKGCFVQKTPRSGYFNHRLKRFVKDANPFSRSGFPDLYVNYLGLGFHLEIKTDVGKLTASQKELLPFMRRAGVLVFVVRSLSETEQIFFGLEQTALKLKAQIQELPSDWLAADLVSIFLKS